MWVAVSSLRGSHRTAEPTVKPFLRGFRSLLLGGLLEGDLPSFGA